MVKDKRAEEGWPWYYYAVALVAVVAVVYVVFGDQLFPQAEEGPFVPERRQATLPWEVAGLTPSSASPAKPDGPAFDASVRGLCEGGEVRDISGHRLHIFRTVGSDVVFANESGEVEVLMVAGGGGGGGRGGSGGGAGGVAYVEAFNVDANGIYDVLVGAGGVGAGGSVEDSDTATNGGDSRFGTYIAVGGGRGRGDPPEDAETPALEGGMGGSGGGGREGGGAGMHITGQGRNGGRSVPSNAGGGGGAGALGENGAATVIGNGGRGRILPQFSGVGGFPAGWFGGGGGAGSLPPHPNNQRGVGGMGGGGSGGDPQNMTRVAVAPDGTPIMGSPGEDGVDGTGGGGGGGSGATADGMGGFGGNGGNGIVILRYPLARPTLFQRFAKNVWRAVRDATKHDED